MMQLCFGIEPKYSLGLVDICNTQTLINGCFKSCGSWNPRRGCVVKINVDDDAAYFVDACRGQYVVKKIDKGCRFLFLRQIKHVELIKPYISEFLEQDVLIVSEHNGLTAEQQKLVGSFYDTDATFYGLSEKNLIHPRFRQPEFLPELLARDGWRFVGGKDVDMLECVGCGVRKVGHELDTLVCDQHKDECSGFPDKLKAPGSGWEKKLPELLDETGKPIDFVRYTLHVPSRDKAAARAITYCDKAVIIRSSRHAINLVSGDEMMKIKKNIDFHINGVQRNLPKKLESAREEYADALSKKGQFDLLERKVDLFFFMMRIENLAENYKHHALTAGIGMKEWSDRRDKLIDVIDELNCVDFELQELTEEHVELLSDLEALKSGQAQKLFGIFSSATRKGMRDVLERKLHERLKEFRIKLENSKLYVLSQKGRLGSLLMFDYENVDLESDVDRSIVRGCEHSEFYLELRSVGVELDALVTELFNRLYMKNILN